MNAKSLVKKYHKMKEESDAAHSHLEGFGFYEFNVWDYDTEKWALCPMYRNQDGVRLNHGYGRYEPMESEITDPAMWNTWVFDRNVKESSWNPRGYEGWKVISTEMKEDGVFGGSWKYMVDNKIQPWYDIISNTWFVALGY